MQFGPRERERESVCVCVCVCLGASACVYSHPHVKVREKEGKRFCPPAVPHDVIFVVAPARGADAPLHPRDVAVVQAVVQRHRVLGRVGPLWQVGEKSAERKKERKRENERCVCVCVGGASE